jgi:MFS family permease
MTTDSRSAVRRLFASRVISLTGGAAAFIALNVMIWDRTRSTAWLAAALLLTFGVEGLAAPFAGALGDRFDRRKLMIISDLAAAAVFTAMALVDSPVILLGLAFLAALAESPFYTASAAAIPNLVADQDLSWANGMVGLGRNAGIVLGPVLGGVLVAAFGAWSVFAMNAVSFVISALLVASVHRPFSGERDGQGDEFQGFRAGFRYLWGDRVLRVLMFAWLIMVFGLGMSMVADLPMVEVFGQSSFGYGVVVAFWGVGTVIGSLVSRRLRAATEPMALVAGLAVVGVTAVVAGVSPWFGLLCGAILVMGWGDGIAGVANQGIMQRRTPDAVRSRVSGAMEACIHGGLAVSYLIGGTAVRALGPRGVYVAGGVLALVGSAVAAPTLLGRTWRWARRLEPELASRPVEASDTSELLLR